MTDNKNSPEFEFFKALQSELDDDDLYYIIKGAEAFSEKEKEEIIKELNLERNT